MATYNTKTITIKVGARYDEKSTKLKADSLECLLVSANTLRKQYEFIDNDYTKITKMRSKMDEIIKEMEYLLYRKMD